MKKWVGRIAGLVVLVLIVGVGLVFALGPGYVEKGMNVVTEPGPYTVAERAETLHETLVVADLHSDSLLWNRDLLKYGDYGHVDVPRLQEGNVALQAFTVVTKSPRGQNFDSNTDETDNITLLAVMQRWPRPTWSSLKERALFQAEKLHDIAARSNGRLDIIKTQKDLEAFLEAREENPELVGGFLGLEGAHPLEGELANVDVLFNAGYRMMGITHFFDNELGGSAHGIEKGGLTEFGRAAVKRMEELEILVDVAHSSPMVVDEILAMATRPVVLSHGGVKGTCDNVRNLSDEHVQGIADTGGVIGIAFFPTATCGDGVRDIAKAIRYTADLVGVEHVALGSDYDGSVSVPFDISGIAKITEALMEFDFNDDEIGLIMGGNVARLLGETLPKG
jgi:membrane dipeptidase